MKLCPACGTEYADEAVFCARDRTPLIVPDATDLVGQVLGERYRIQRKLGEGGMGTVYLAEHVLMGRPCAVKVVSPALTRDPDAVGRFNREAMNASRITHPNVTAVYDFGLTPDGLVYLAMELVEGTTLSEVLSREGHLPAMRVAAIVHQCAAGLQAAHELQIVHRDLKPDNIMLVPGRTGEVVKLVDFGIAKAMGSEPDVGGKGQEVTKAGMVVGTPEYMSPEQLANDPIDGRSDLYSLAIVAYRMLTGALPFAADSLQETMVKRLTDPVPSLTNALPGGRFPTGLQAVMDRGLARAPRDRYPTVHDFADAMVRAVETAEVAARDQVTMVVGQRTDVSTRPPPTRVAARPRRHSGSRAAVAFVGVALAATAGWAAWNQLGEGSSAATPPSGTVGSQDTAVGDSLSGSSSQGAVVPPPPAPPESTSSTRPPSPSPGGGNASDAALSLPSIDMVTSDNPVLRRRARAMSTRVYDAQRAPVSWRAQAAYNLYLMALEERQYRVALNWIDNAVALDPRPTWIDLAQRLQQNVNPRRP